MTLDNNQLEKITDSPIDQSLYGERYVNKNYGFKHITISFGGKRKLYLTDKNISDAVNKMIAKKIIRLSDLRINKIDWKLSNNIFYFMAIQKGFIIEFVNNK